LSIIPAKGSLSRILGTIPITTFPSTVTFLQVSILIPNALWKNIVLSLNKMLADYLI
jgi:hypothetical protein